MRAPRSARSTLALLLFASVASLRAADATAPSVLTASPDAAPRIVAHDVSPPLRDLVPASAPADSPRLATDSPPPLLPPAFTMPLVNFDALSNLAAVYPPDPSGDVGPQHYVLMTNLYLAIYDKSGSTLYGPAANNVLWAGFGGSCETRNDGLPKVLYDQRADRWLLAQPVFESGPGNLICLAVSASGDPTGSYYRWAMDFENRFPDYPVLAATRDSYVVTTREFLNGSSFYGIGVYALRRSDFLAGAADPAIVGWQLLAASFADELLGDGLIPVDLDGKAPLPAGTADILLGLQDDGGPYTAASDALNVWRIDPDYEETGLSLIAYQGAISVAAFDSQFPCSPTSRDCIPQPGTTEKLDFLSYRQRLMPRAVLRYVGDDWRIVASHAVEATGAMAGIRWYELRDDGSGGLSLYQQGTYSPGSSDAIHRWLPSVATDRLGGMAIGFSASNGTATYPTVRYAGRLAGDPAGALSQGEGSIVEGTGSQTGTASRWGSFSSTTVDPDDCTIWHAGEYIPTTSSSGWRIRVAAFRFPACTPVLFADGFDCGSWGAWSASTP
jgi:hypothetical protein